MVEGNALRSKMTHTLIYITRAANAALVMYIRIISYAPHQATFAYAPAVHRHAYPCNHPMSHRPPRHGDTVHQGQKDYALEPAPRPEHCHNRCDAPVHHRLWSRQPAHPAVQDRPYAETALYRSSAEPYCVYHPSLDHLNIKTDRTEPVIT